MLREFGIGLGLGYDLVEYKWVRDTVLTAWFQVAVQELGEGEVVRLTKKRAEVTDDVERRMLDYQIEKLQRESEPTTIPNTHL